MSVQILDLIKKQAGDLSAKELQELANHFSTLARQSVENQQVSAETKDRQLAWLKANRDKYAGQYVALDDDVLVAHAGSLQEIRQQTKGRKNLFVVKVFAEETTVSAGL